MHLFATGYLTTLNQISSSYSYRIKLGLYKTLKASAFHVTGSQCLQNVKEALGLHSIIRTYSINPLQKRIVSFLCITIGRVTSCNRFKLVCNSDNSSSYSVFNSSLSASYFSRSCNHKMQY